MAKMTYEESKQYLDNKKIMEKKEREAAINIIRVLRDQKFTTAQILDIVDTVRDNVTYHSYVSEDF